MQTAKENIAPEQRQQTLDFYRSMRMARATCSVAAPASGRKDNAHKTPRYAARLHAASIFHLVGSVGVLS